MSQTTVQIRRMDARGGDIEVLLGELRERLSPRGDIVSDAARRRTVEIFGRPLSPAEVVETICRDVRQRGVAAVLDYTARIDRVTLTPDTLRVPINELARAHAAADPDFLEAVRRIRRNVEEFQRAILHESVRIERPQGVVLSQRYVPLERVGIYFPGGAAAYPSTVLMTVVPAQTAGVAQVAVVSPPTPRGAYHPDLLATCHELGIDEVYRVGGAQAIAALAYGTEGIPAVDKIFGPGNLFVALAKKYVFGEVDIDAIAGPSEVLVIADETTRPDFAAADLLAQAEHTPGASILVTWSERVFEDTFQELSRQAAKLPQSAGAIESLEQFGALILVRNEDEAVAIANLMAPEHLHIATAEPQQLLQRMPHAGAVFLGTYSPVAVGDYVAGPSHVLPTGGTARFMSGLSVNDFQRTHSVIHYTRAGLESVAGLVATLANKEGLPAHRVSVDIRLRD